MPVEVDEMDELSENEAEESAPVAGSATLGASVAESTCTELISC